MGEGKKELGIEELKSVMSQMDNFIKELSKENTELKNQLAEMYNQLRNKSIDISFKVIELCEKNDRVNDYLDQAYLSAVNIINYYLDSIDPKNNNDDEKEDTTFEETYENDLSEEKFKIDKVELKIDKVKN